MGRKTFAICLGISLIMIYSCGGNRKAAMAKDDFKKDGYNLVWSDEFNKVGAPDSSNWSYEKGFERNEEFQWYQPENAFCKNGLLVLEARKETKMNPQFKEGSEDWKKNRRTAEYTSASIKTSHKRSWQYGRFVMRGKISIDDGIWPAWWTLGIAGKWPADGEIDIMEFYRKKLLANIAFMGAENKAEWYSLNKNTDSLGGKNWANKFHIWRMDWDEQAIAMYVDDMLINKTELSKLENKDGTGINPFKQPHFMLLDLAIGGQQGGNPANTHFPKKFEIDYVRVYQKAK